MKKLMTVAALAVLALGVGAQANAAVNVRQLNQERRIDAGVRSGKLTRGEAARLRAEQRSIHTMSDRRKMRYGGHLTRADKRMLHMRQEEANRHILRQKHDAQRGKNHLKVHI